MASRNSRHSRTPGGQAGVSRAMNIPHFISLTNGAARPPGDGESEVAAPRTLEAGAQEGAADLGNLCRITEAQGAVPCSHSTQTRM